MKQFLGDCLKEVCKQLFSTKPSSRIIYTKNSRKKMSEYRITEEQVTEVFTKGENVKEGMRVRKYNGYHIGICYSFDKQRYGYVIISCWKSKIRK